MARGAWVEVPASEICEGDLVRRLSGGMWVDRIVLLVLFGAAVVQIVYDSNSYAPESSEHHPTDLVQRWERIDNDAPATSVSTSVRRSDGGWAVEWPHRVGS